MNVPLKLKNRVRLRNQCQTRLLLCSICPKCQNGGDVICGWPLQSKLKCIGDITGISGINDTIIVSLVCVIPLINLSGITSINSITGMGGITNTGGITNMGGMTIPYIKLGLFYIQRGDSGLRCLLSRCLMFQNYFEKNFEFKNHFMRGYCCVVKGLKISVLGEFFGT